MPTVAAARAPRLRSAVLARLVVALAAVPVLLVAPAPGSGRVPEPAPGSGRVPDPAPGSGAVAGARAPAAVAAPVSRAAAGWRAPVPGAVTLLRPFAVGAQRWSPGHRGVDLALPPGAPVLAAGPGRVVFAGPVAGRGVVSVAHGALRTTYEPLEPSVRAGDVVAAGAELGLLAPGHSPCGGCLHWGLRRGEDYLDPMRLLRPARVRLLPLASGPP